jgi:hypothetical protein
LHPLAQPLLGEDRWGASVRGLIRRTASLVSNFEKTIAYSAATIQFHTKSSIIFILRVKQVRTFCLWETDQEARTGTKTDLREVLSVMVMILFRSTGALETKSDALYKPILEINGILR